MTKPGRVRCSLGSENEITLKEVIVKGRLLSVALSILCWFPLHLHAAQEEGVVEMRVKRVILDPYSKTPVVILESAKEGKLMPIWIGNEEATSIALELEHVAAPRPNTHDLIRNILHGVGAAIHRITITDLRNNIYYAIISLKLKGQDFQVDSRPSDAIAIALRMKAPIYASGKVLAKAKPLPPDQPRADSRKILGIHAQELTPDLAGLFDLKVKSGVLVADVELGSAASQAGLQRGDLILKVNDKTIQKVADLESALQGTKKGAEVKVEILRKGKSVTVAIELPS
jgi:bifunctional DNase/RNase